MHDIRIEDIKDLPDTKNIISCISGSGMPGATRYDEMNVKLSLLRKIVKKKGNLSYKDIINFQERIRGVKFLKTLVNKELALAATIRNHLQNIAKRQEKELEGQSEYISYCQNELDKLPKPAKPLLLVLMAAI